MKNLLFLFILLCSSSLLHATTWNVTTASNIQTVINGTSAGDTVAFASGSYSLSGITLKCGVTYTGPATALKANGMSTGQTAILNGSNSGNADIFNLYSTPSTYVNPCTQPTTIEFLSFMNEAGIYVQSSFTNLSIIYNNFGGIPCCSYSSGAWAMYFDGTQTTSNTTQQLGNVLIQWNTIGDANSCTAAFADNTSSDGDGDAAQCGGITWNTSTSGPVQLLNNNYFHTSEANHVNCPGGNYPGQGSNPCEPTSNGVIIDNFIMKYNDLNQTHRMSLEFQPQTTSGDDIEDNDVHDPIMTGFSFAFSMACCSSAGNSPYIDLSNNVIIYNTSPYGRYGYGIEAWGRDGTFNNNLEQAGYSAAAAITWNCGPVSNIANNNIQGTGWSGDYISSEGTQSAGYCSSSTPQETPANQTGNNTTTTISTSTSAVPTISPASGSYSGSQVVTFTNAGNTSGAGPLGNTGTWYTTDGSTPVPGSNGKYTTSGGTITLTGSGTTTVKAIGMWGAQNQPTSYASGYGFVPSAVVTNTYIGSGGPTLTSCTQSNTGSVNTINVGGYYQQGASCYYASLPSPGLTNCTTADAYGNAVTQWGSTNGSVLTVGAVGAGSLCSVSGQGAGCVKGIGAGTANSTAMVGSTVCSPWTWNVSAITPTLSSVTISLQAGGSSVNAGSTVQACANMAYTSPTENTQVCGGGTDTYGTAVSNYTSSTSNATMGSTTGILLGVTAGSTNIGVTAGTFTTTPLAITVNPTPISSPVVINGPIQFQGTVVIQ